MKRFIIPISFVSLFLTVFISSCQSDLEPGSDFNIPELEIFKGDADKKLSHNPTGVVYIETKKQSVKIDFSLGEYFTHYITTYNKMEIYTYDSKLSADGNEIKIFEGNIYDIPTLGELVDIYKRYKLKVCIPFSSSSAFAFVPYEMDAVYVLPKLEYALAQECFWDNFNTQTRKAILQMVLEKKIGSDWFALNDLFITAKKTRIFLMAIILIKENDADFISAIQKNAALKKDTTILKFDNEGCAYWMHDLYDLVSQYAKKYLSKNI